MGSIGFPELLLIFFVVLLVFGPKSLPTLGRSLGQAMRQFRRATAGGSDDGPEQGEQEEDESITRRALPAGTTRSRSGAEDGEDADAK